MPRLLRCKLSNYSHPLSLYTNRNKRAIRPFSAGRMRAYRLMPTPNRLRSMHIWLRHTHIWLRHTHIWLMLTYIGLAPTPHRTYVYRTSDLRLSHIGLTSISHRTCAYPTSDLRLSHIGLAPTTHQTCAYPTFRLVYAHIRLVSTHMRTCKQTPTSLYQRACIRYLRAPAFY